MSIADDDWNAQNAGSEMLVHLAATFQQAVNGVGVTAHAICRWVKQALSVHFITCMRILWFHF